MALSENKTKFKESLLNDFKEAAKTLKKNMADESSSPDDILNVVENNSIYKIHVEINNEIENLCYPNGEFITNLNSDEVKKRIYHATTVAWSNYLGKLLEDFSSILADKIVENVDTYLKTAQVTVTIPPGLVSQGGGIATIPNPAPITLTGNPSAIIEKGGLS